MTAGADPVGSLAVALEHAARLLSRNPALAVEQAREILKVLPRQPAATLLLGRGQRALGDDGAALETLEALCAAQPGFAAAHLEFGIALRDAGRGDAALAALRRAVAVDPAFAPAWLALADLYTDLGATTEADAAYLRHVGLASRDPRLMAAGAALYANDLPRAESLLREHLLAGPTDVAALRMLAEVAARLRRYTDAETLLRRCVELAPGFLPARHNLALVLHRQNNAAEALREVEYCLVREPRHVGHRNLKAAILGTVGEYDASIALYREVLQEYPTQAKVWMSFGHVLKTAGLEAEGIAAYRRALELQPTLGEAYWSLANLKTFRFTDDDRTAMAAALDDPALDAEARYHFDFALGKALEDSAEYERSFRHYDAGNRGRRRLLDYRAGEQTARLKRSEALFTDSFLAAREGMGCPAPDPIFIVGLPRAGSTLLEQILASHSMVEGTMELPYIIAMARRLAREQADADGAHYPGVLADLEPGQWRALGEEYLAAARIHRKLGRPYFIDKMPNNFQHLGLILVALPRARIIDARRHPLACCFSGFKQHFAMGQQFSYSLDDLGRYYRDYVGLMAHFDRVAPGRVHRVYYERLVADTEGEVRRLLDYCGLPFEDGCLRFYENARAVRTASSAQVRRPIFRDGVDQWRHYEPWLGPLKAALGPLIESYAAEAGLDP